MVAVLHHFYELEHPLVVKQCLAVSPLSLFSVFLYIFFDDCNSWLGRGGGGDEVRTAAGINVALRIDFRLPNAQSVRDRGPLDGGWRGWWMASPGRERVKAM